MIVIVKSMVQSRSRVADSMVETIVGFILQGIIQFLSPTAYGICWGTSTSGVYLSIYPAAVPHFKACDWSTRFMRVISLGLSLVKPVLQYRLEYSRVCIGCVQKCTHLY